MIKIQEDIASIKAAIAAIKSGIDSVFEVMKDGKVDLKDITELPALFSTAKSLVESIKGIGPEIKDLDPSEIKEVLADTIDLIMYAAQKFGVAV